MVEFKKFDYKHADINDIRIIGDPERIGSKARDLVKKSPDLRQIGLSVPKTLVFAEDCFDNLFLKCGIENSRGSISCSKYSEEELIHGNSTYEDTVLKSLVSDYFGPIPLLNRFSGEGDSDGNGIYESRFSSDGRLCYEYSLRNVLLSYFSESAFEYRKNNHIKNGFGIIVQPIIDQCFAQGVHAPLLSGFGYSKSIKHEGPAYIYAVPMLGGGVRKSPLGLKSHFMYFKEKITLDDVLKSDWNLAHLIIMRGIYGQYYDSEENRIMYGSFELGRDVMESLFFLDMASFFRKIKSMNDVFGVPQYFEWVLTIKNSNPEFNIVQIADINTDKSRSVSLDGIDLKDDRLMYLADYAIGTGSRESNSIYHFDFSKTLAEGDFFNHLYSFNKFNKDYVLILPDSLTSYFQNIPYSHYSNAAVVLEEYFGSHANNPDSHFEGTMKGKLFGIVQEGRASHSGYCEVEETAFGKIFKGSFTIFGCEKEDRLIVLNNGKR